MTDLARRVQRTYLTLLLGSTLAASFIWGINTLFLLDAGLSNLEAFAANAFFTAGMVLFEVPTGVVADTWGRRASYLLGTLTLAASTLLYYFMWQWEAAFVWWAIVSALLGLGFTFFSGAVEAWLVDALHHAEYEGTLEAVFGRGQMVAGVAMLGGSVARWGRGAGDRPRGPVPAAGRRAGHHVRGRVQADARPRLRTGPAREPDPSDAHRRRRRRSSTD